MSDAEQEFLEAVAKRIAADQKARGIPPQEYSPDAILCFAYDEHVDRVAELKDCLLELCEVYVSNRGTEHEFICAVTPGPKTIPYYWREAIRLTYGDVQ